jgi:hypothetical protein
MTTTNQICVACRERPSTTAKGESAPPLCRRCWEREGQGIEIGVQVIDTIGGERGRVRGFDEDHIAIVDLDEGGNAYLPTRLLVAVLD